MVLLLAGLLNFSPVQAKVSKTKIKNRNISSDSYSAVLAKYKINPEQVSIQLLDGNQEIFAVNADQKKSPASVTKLLTSFAVLKKLPFGHRFYTKLYSDGVNLYLRGGGDPTFVSENLWVMVNELTRSSLKNIKGNLVVDDSLFDKVRFDDSRIDHRVDRAYDSPVGAMSFNWNAVNIFVKPTKPGEPARVTADPECKYFTLVNNTRTVAGVAKNELVVSISNEERLISISGDVSVASEEKAIYKAVSDPDIWSGANLIYFLQQRNIHLEGRIITGPVPEKAELVASFESKSLSNILADMNKFSNNFVAEMLTKGLAAQEQKQEQKNGATLKRGVEIIREELANIGITRDEVSIVNPSGLTSNNLISAATLNKVLSYVKNDFSIYPTFLDGLPIAGVDGTLKKRMKGTLAEGWVRAKTGRLDGVVSLAGFAGRRDGKVYTFSFLYNGPQNEDRVRSAFDELVITSLK